MVYSFLLFAGLIFSQVTLGSQLYVSSRKATTDGVATDGVVNKLCSDGRSECPSGNTCFRRSTGEYSCCPLPQATGCLDDIHCCPNGYKCGHDDCTKDEVKIPLHVIQASKFVAKQPHLKSEATADGRFKSNMNKYIPCSDGRSECPSNTTCCNKRSTGQYGCCPGAQAACCADSIHCCPNGYECAQGNCVRYRIPFQMSLSFQSAHLFAKQLSAFQMFMQVVKNVVATNSQKGTEDDANVRFQTKQLLRPTEA